MSLPTSITLLKVLTIWVILALINNIGECHSPHTNNACYSYSPYPPINLSSPPLNPPTDSVTPSISPLTSPSNPPLNPPINALTPSISPSSPIIHNPPISPFSPLISPSNPPTNPSNPPNHPTNPSNPPANSPNPSINPPTNSLSPSISPISHTNPPINTPINHFTPTPSPSTTSPSPSINSPTDSLSPLISPSSHTNPSTPPISPPMFPVTPSSAPVPSMFPITPSSAPISTPINPFSPTPSPSNSPIDSPSPSISPSSESNPSSPPLNPPTISITPSVSPSSPPLSPSLNTSTPSITPSPSPSPTNSSSPSGLQVGFYKGLCPSSIVDVEASITAKVQEHFRKDPTLLPALLRLQFHDCFVHGCDASILIDGPSSEKVAGPNLSVRGYEFIDALKDEAEAECPGVVSCADIIAIATKGLIKLGGGPEYSVETGRRDGLISKVQDVRLPSPFAPVIQSILAFRHKNFTIEEMVALFGCHTVGISNCVFFQDRLYEGTSDFDPNMDPNLREQLIPTCPQGITANNFTILDQNPESSNIVDNSFYDQILKQRGILPIDQALARDRLTRGFVLQFARNPALFNDKLISSMIKLQAVDVLTGDKGEIRKVCSRVNKGSQV